MAEKTENELIRPANWWDALPREGYRNLEEIETGQASSNSNCKTVQNGPK